MKARIAMLSCAIAASVPALALAGALDTFPLPFGTVVSNGVPGAGAGNIEALGNVDQYTFNGTAGQKLFFDELSFGCNVPNWVLTGPTGVVFNDVRLSQDCSGGDKGHITLPDTGAYTLSVQAGPETPTFTGVYSFAVYLLPAPDAFALTLNAPVSNGVPGAGAGNIEIPGDSDVYTFAGAAGQKLFFDEVSVNCEVPSWTLAGPGGTVFSDSRLSQNCGGGDFGHVTLPSNGMYTLTVAGSASIDLDFVGTYAFTVYSVETPAPVALAFDSIVSNGVPIAGAGNIEKPGASDVYTFAGAAGQELFFDELSINCDVPGWTLVGPSGTVFNDTRLSQNCGGGDVGNITLPAAGLYTLTVSGNPSVDLDFVGTYSFAVYDNGRSDMFNLPFDSTVSEGVPAPGAGAIEEPGVIDIYTFSADAGTMVFFDELSFNCDVPGWKLVGPGAVTIFDDSRISQNCGTGDAGRFTLPATGQYTLTVSGGPSVDPDFAGTYSFAMYDVETDAFEIGLDEVIMDGFPGPGAGRIEQPGGIDIYLFDAVAGQSICFDELSPGCDAPGWKCQAPSGATFFDDSRISSNCGAGDVGLKVMPETGTYIITVQGYAAADLDFAGTYSFRLISTCSADFNCDGDVTSIDLNVLLSGFGCIAGPGQSCGGDVDKDGDTDSVDLNLMLAVFGQPCE